MINGIQKEVFEILTLEKYTRNLDFYELAKATHKLLQLKHNSLICTDCDKPTVLGTELSFRLTKSQLEFQKELITLTEFITKTALERADDVEYLKVLIKEEDI